MKKIIFYFIKSLRLFLNIDYLFNFFKYGVCATTEFRSLLKDIDFDTLIDIGANKGQFSLLCAVEKKNVRIFAFEPIKSEFLILKKVLKNYKNVNLYNVGLGLLKETKVIHLANKPDSSSFLEFELQTKFFKNIKPIDVEICKIRKLDSFYDSICNKNTKKIFIKIDVQGFEELVIKGGLKVISNSKFILIEVSFVALYRNQARAEKIISILYENGFVIKNIINSTIQKNRVIQSDLLFENTKNNVQYK